MKTDVLRRFVDSMSAASIGHGFYYSVGNNMYLNVNNGYAMPLNGTDHKGNWVGLLPGKRT